jgi:dihydroneopterin aldolase
MPEPLAKERPPLELSDEEKIEDYLDYCAASEAIEEALETGKIMKTSDFAKELDLEYRIA